MDGDLLQEDADNNEQVLKFNLKRGNVRKRIMFRLKKDTYKEKGIHLLLSQHSSKRHSKKLRLSDRLLLIFLVWTTSIWTFPCIKWLSRKEKVLPVTPFFPNALSKVCFNLIVFQLSGHDLSHARAL